MSSQQQSAKAKRRSSRIIRAAAPCTAGIAVIVLVAGAVYQYVCSRRDSQRYPPPGRLVDIGGYSLHLHCMGAGGITVVFDSGLSDDSLAWYKVQPAIAKRARACTYDRGGLGWSDPSPLPRTSRVMATELHTLCNKRMWIARMSSWVILLAE